MATRKTPSQTDPLPRIFVVRRHKVVLDAELAKLYGVPVKRLNEAVRRNRERFPADFTFLLKADEVAILRSQFATLTDEQKGDSESHSAVLRSGGHGRHSKYAPRVFTEHGALMPATVLRADRAIQMSVYLVRAFVEMREALLANATILKRLAEIDRRLVEHDSVLRDIIDRLQPLLDAPDVDEESKPKIGYHQGNR